MQTIANRKTSKGTPVTIQLREGQGAYQAPELVIELPTVGLKFNARPYSILKPEMLSPAARPLCAEAAKEGYVAGVTGPKNGMVFLFAEELAAYEAAVERWNATPERVEANLRDQRESLCISIRAIEDQEAYEKERAWERGQEMRGVTDSEEYKANKAAAWQALRDFNAAHPEIIAGINAEKEEAHQRWLNAD